jgi:hypothetical protein
MITAGENRTAFISYRHGKDGRDFAYACRIKEAVDDLHWTPFLAPACIAPGSDWRIRIRDFLLDTDLFIAVLTKEWAKSEWTRFELRLYVDSCERQSKSVVVVPFAFEEVTELEHVEPLFHSLQRVDCASQLTNAEICWAMYAAIPPTKGALRSEWHARGVELLRSSDAARAPAEQTEANQVALRDQLVSRFKSISHIREIGYALPVEVPPNLPEDPAVAWYQIIMLAAKNPALIKRLRTLTGLRQTG